MALDLKASPPKSAVVAALIVLGLSLTGLTGFFLGKAFYPQESQTSNQTSPFLAVKGAGLLQTQTATITGRIIRIDTNRLVVQNAEGQSAAFAFIPTVLISKPASGVAISSTSGVIKNLELNKDVSITLVVQNNEYVITSINYLPDSPTFPSPTPTSKAKT